MARQQIRRRPVRLTDEVGETSRFPGTYIGWTGHANLGDEACLVAARLLLDWSNLETGLEKNPLVVLGGGTLLGRSAGRNSYLSKLRVLTSNSQALTAVLGTGVADLEFWRGEASLNGWKRYLEKCSYIGVRGPRSLAALERLNLRRDVEIVGDLALLLRSPRVPTPVTGRVLINVLHARGILWGSDDTAVLKAVGGVTNRLVKEGWDVRLLALSPEDTYALMQVQEYADMKSLPLILGYANLDFALQEIANAELVMGERLHSLVLAAAVGTPFVGLEYRPKCLDFAESVEQPDLLMRTDAVNQHRLFELLQDVSSRRDELAAALNTRVEEFRARILESGRQIHLKALSRGADS
jgi:polysaccharide pyruvyl transferase WcaK-like protein